LSWEWSLSSWEWDLLSWEWSLSSWEWGLFDWELMSFSNWMMWNLYGWMRFDILNVWLSSWEWDLCNWLVSSVDGDMLNWLVSSWEMWLWDISWMLMWQSWVRALVLMMEKVLQRFQLVL
jgi:hypothetical protein